MGHMTAQCTFAPEDTVRALSEQHRAQVPCRVKGNCLATHARLRGMVGSGPTVYRYSEKWTLGSGHRERRTFEVVAVAAEDWRAWCAHLTATREAAQEALLARS